MANTSNDTLLSSLLNGHVTSANSAQTAAKIVLAGVTLQNAIQTARTLAGLGVSSTVQTLLPALATATTDAELTTAVIAVHNALAQNQGVLGGILSQL